MRPIMLFGAGIGAGLFLIVRSLMATSQSLAAQLGQLDRVGLSVADQRLDQGGRRAQFGRLLSGRLGQRVERDLAVLELDAAGFAAKKLISAVSFAVVGVLLAVVFGAAKVGLPGAALSMLVVIAGALGFVLPDEQIRRRAALRRDSFTQALSSYLDLVNVLLAGGAGIETALEAAAEAGDGWAFATIRRSLLRSRTMRQTPWASFEELADTIGVAELGEVAASVRLAGEHGARIKSSLTAKASALRARQMAEIEAKAQSATERMGLPTVVLFLGFMVLLGYPAMQQIVRGL